MRLLIRNLLGFIIRFLLVVLALIVLSAIMIGAPRWRIGAEKHILVTGDSHAECAIDDSVFVRSVNFAKSGMAFIYTYGTIKKLVADNPQIDTILLSFQFNSLIYDRERRWVYNDAVLFTKVPVFLPYWDLHDMSVFGRTPAFYKALMQTPRICAEYYFQLTKGAAADWRRENIGHHLSLPYNRLKEDTAATTPYAELGKKDTVSPVQLEYLQKIGEYCRKKGITLILINTPVYEPEKYAGWLAYEANRQRYLKDFLFLDYSRFPIPDSCYGDLYHLNRQGARLFSAYLQDHLATDLHKKRIP